MKSPIILKHEFVPGVLDVFSVLDVDVREILLWLLLKHIVVISSVPTLADISARWISGSRSSGQASLFDYEPPPFAQTQ